MSDDSQPVANAPAQPKKRKNLRTPELMKLVQEQVESHYRSPVVEYLRHTKSYLSANGLTVKLAKAFGFCYGVERAINLAYASPRLRGPQYLPAGRDHPQPRGQRPARATWASSSSRKRAASTISTA